MVLNTSSQWKGVLISIAGFNPGYVFALVVGVKYRSYHRAWHYSAELNLTKFTLNCNSSLLFFYKNLMTFSFLFFFF